MNKQEQIEKLVRFSSRLIQKISVYLRPTKFKIAFVLLLVFFSVVLFGVFIARVMYCLECDISPIATVLYLLFLLPGSLIMELDRGPHGVIMYSFSLLFTVIYFYIIACFLASVCLYFGQKIFKDKIIRQIKRYLTIILALVLITMVGYVSFSIMKNKIKSQFHIREARSFESSTFVVGEITCERRITRYDVIGELDFTYDNILAYEAMVFDPVVEEFIVYGASELTLGTPEVGLLGIDPDGQLHGVAFDAQKGMYSWEYGEKMEYRKMDYDLKEMLKYKVNIESVSDGKRLYFSGNPIGDVYFDIRFPVFSLDGKRMAFAAKPDIEKEAIVICEL